MPPGGEGSPSKISRHELTHEERRRGGKTASAKRWAEVRTLKAKRDEKTENPTTADDFREIGRRLDEELELGRVPPFAATPVRLLRMQEEARRYPPGVWTDDQRAWRRRLAEMGEIGPEDPEEPPGDGQEPPEL